MQRLTYSVVFSFAAACIPAAVLGATYSASMAEIDVDSSGLFSEATFDLGVRFDRIEAVSLEISMPDGLSGGVCSGSLCWSSSIHLAIYDASHPADFSVVPLSTSVSTDPNVLLASFGYVIAGRLTETKVLPPNPRLDLDSFEFLFDPWPEFLFTGQGTLGMQQVSTWSCYLNCSDSGSSAAAPAGVSSVRLIVQGVPVPEPSTDVLMFVMTTLALAQIRRCDRTSRWQCLTHIHVRPPGTCPRGLRRGTA